jgi:AraC-like DNA-binding protein
MPTVAALLDSRAALLHLRRTLPAGPGTLVACRSQPGLRRLYRTRLLDAVVLGLRGLRHRDLPGLRNDFPAVPVVVYGAFRPDDGELLHQLVSQGGVADVVVEGVDDAVVGALVRRHALSGIRAEALADAPRLLRLTEDLQRRAWAHLLAHGGQALQTGDLAVELGMSREHLSRQFAAGGAPNLKRVIDLLRVAAAAQLLANPGYDLGTVAGILGFATRSHLHATTRRITGVGGNDLARLGPRGVLLAFRREGMRSRV